ncbi:NAD(P)-dependent oxidoreductase [Anaerosphaera multitolerans]|uniref:3-phosphoglycerate dehydrogenase n=1 Tax=Anaerosphaera multitolerans TaxID=2487351 RepID=A0A437S595_9FIRM|nr:NAD(P)-dependent oxidoreductase [Anaerosphaera multitolerans]RVU54212.1 3-phosphoglycerate dehydrogenase [Anaerosphaera multitolerans]
MKLLVRAPMVERDLNRLKGVFSEIIYNPWTITGERYYEDEMIELLTREKPDGLIIELDEITEKVIRNYKGLKFIGDCRATPENIDVKSCSAYGIPLLTTPGRNAQAVAELWLSTVIMFLRNVLASMKWMEEENWIDGTTPYYLFRGNELYEKHVGFIGMGAVPRAIFKLLKPFNCKVSYYDPYLKNEIEGAEKVSLEEIFKNCEIVSVHLPSNENTREMIDEKLLNLMKEDAIFINSSRSNVVDNKKLYRVLDERKIRGAIIDVFDVEPPIGGKTIFDNLDNVILTPHIYGATFEVVNHQSKIITDKILKFIDGENLEEIIFNSDILTGES